MIGAAARFTQELHHNAVLVAGVSMLMIAVGSAATWWVRRSHRGNPDRGWWSPHYIRAGTVVVIGVVLLVAAVLHW